jgi:hypothetical protein
MPEILEKMENVLLKLHTRIIVNRKKSKKKTAREEMKKEKENKKRKHGQKKSNETTKLQIILDVRVLPYYNIIPRNLVSE